MFLRLLIVTGQFEKTKMLNVLDFMEREYQKVMMTIVLR